MSYEQVMDHAEEIRKAAIEKTIEHLGGRRNSRSYMSRKRPEIEAAFADVPDLYRPFASMPDPAAYNGLIKSVEGALAKLSSGQLVKDPIDGAIYPANTEMLKISGAESYLEEWTGEAAQMFIKNFITPYPGVLANQFILAAVLKSALEAHQAMWTKARDDIDAIAHKTLTALDAMDDCGKNEWTVAFTVVASVAAVAAVPVTGGASLAITAVGATAQVVAAVGPEDPPKNEFSGESAEAVINAMRQGIHKLYEAIGATEQRIAKALGDVHTLVGANRDLFVARRPALAGTTAGTITGPDGLGYSR